MRAAFPLLLLAVGCAASVPCATDLDCNLNGVCNPDSGACTCDSGWTGPSCALLALYPSKPGDGTCDPSRNGTAVGFATTWGGVPMQDPTTLRWHVHVAEMANHCGMTL